MPKSVKLEFLGYLTTGCFKIESPPMDGFQFLSQGPCTVLSCKFQSVVIFCKLLSGLGESTCPRGVVSAVGQYMINCCTVVCLCTMLCMHNVLIFSSIDVEDFSKRSF